MIALRTMAFSVVAFIGFCVLAEAGSVDKYTARYYEAMSYKYLNQEVKLAVTHIDASRRAALIHLGGRNVILVPGHRTFMAYTCNKSVGGCIPVTVPQDHIEYVVEKYGISAHRDGQHRVNTRKMKGILRELTDGIIYVEFTK